MVSIESLRHNPKGETWGFLEGPNFYLIEVLLNIQGSPQAERPRRSVWVEFVTLSIIPTSKCVVGGPLCWRGLVRTLTCTYLYVYVYYTRMCLNARASTSMESYYVILFYISTHKTRYNTNIHSVHDWTKMSWIFVIFSIFLSVYCPLPTCSATSSTVQWVAGNSV